MYRPPFLEIISYRLSHTGTENSEPAHDLSSLEDRKFSFQVPEQPIRKL